MSLIKPLTGNQYLQEKDVLETGWQMQMIGIYRVLDIGEFLYPSGEQKIRKKKFVLVL